MKNVNIINQFMVLFLVMGIGYYGRKRNIITSEMNKGMSQLLLRITLPFMIIVSFDYKFSPELMSNIVKILIYSLIIHIFLIPLSNMFYNKVPKNKDKKDILRFVTVFSNTGFIGYPVLASIYGKVGVLYASIFNIPFNVFMWTFGIMLFSGDKNDKSLKKVLANPGIIAVIIGTILFIFSIKIPYPIQKTLEIVGSITTPISMIIVGSMLAEVKVKDVFAEKSIYYASVLRLLVIPFFIFLILKLMKVDSLLINICVIVEAMPAAVVCSIFAESYNKNPKFASQSVFITTLLSVITIPIVIMFLSNFS
ncbi:AEC family transporter [Haloimpatiens sp. FM7330]|uniref:AEC family transporter n=1 Tax=Haloimpatiens sp. FM7330 TaxID=3298610 RepID=UPI0036364D77